MTPTELTNLRHSLAPFGEAALPGALQQFLDFYNLDFSAAQTPVQYQSGLLPSGNFQLMAHRWLLPQARANLLLVHGYYDHTGIYDKLIAYGLSRNCNVLIFDLPGHGLSSGDRAEIDDFADYGEAVASVIDNADLPQLPLFALGQSTGCAALVELARRHRWPFDRTVLLAPLVRPAGWLSVRVAHTLLRPFTESIARNFNINSSDFEFLDFIRRDPLQCHRISLRWLGALRRWLADLKLQDLGVGPVLVIQGRKDGTVDWRYNMGAVGKLFPGSRIHYLPKAGHQLANESGAIREDYFRVLDDYLFD